MAIRTVFPCSAVPAEEMPPQSTTNLGLEGGKSQPFAVTMKAQGLGYTNSETVKNPYSLATVVHPERSLRYVSMVMFYSIQAGRLAT